MWAIFKVFIEVCYNIASVLCFGFLALRHVGILATQPGIELLFHTSCMGRQSLKHWTTREVSSCGCLISIK